MVEQPGPPPEDKKEPLPPIPDSETLSYDPNAVDLTRTPIDWDLTEPEAWDSLPADQKEAILREQHRRLYHALTDLSKRLAFLIPPEDGARIDTATDKVLNPDKYPITPEEPRVSPDSPGDVE